MKRSKVRIEKEFEVHVSAHLRRKFKRLLMRIEEASIHNCAFRKENEAFISTHLGMKLKHL